MKHRSIIAGALASAGIALGAAGAQAAPTGDYADFLHCPYTNPAVQSCIVSTTTSGSFQLGNATVPINKSIKLQGGTYRDTSAPTGFRWVNAVGADTLQKVALDVPGGLTGLVVPELIRDIPLLGPIFDAAVNSVNGVKATAELVGDVQFNFTAYVTGASPTAVLPVRIKLDNPFLGGSCYIGSAANPVTLRLTTGTTAPAAPNTPITGTRGTLQYLNGAQLIIGSNNRLVDNAFAVPSASDCGPWGFRWAVTPIVNLKEGFPSAAGTNTAILEGGLKSGAATAVRASDS